MQDKRAISANTGGDGFSGLGMRTHLAWQGEQFEGDLDSVSASPEEIQYLCDVSNEYFEQQISPDDVVSTYSGVRPLYDDGASQAQEATRDYVFRQDGGIEVNDDENNATNKLQYI